MPENWSTSMWIGIVASFLASIVWYNLFFWWRALKIKWKLKDIEDKYYHYQLNGEIVEGNYSTISFESPNILHFDTHSEKDHNWGARVEMNELIPKNGTGYFEYDYSDKESWGTINIQIKDNDDILVHSIHKEMQNNKGISYMMKKTAAS